MDTRNIENIYPLSPMQQGMLFHSLRAPNSGVYVEQNSATLRGELDIQAFAGAWQHLLDRHSILRTAFLWEDLEEPLQVVYRKLKMPVDTEDWSDIPVPEQTDRLAKVKQRERAIGFDVVDAPLMRIKLIKTGGTEYQLVWTFHHLLYDGWSYPILLQELFTLYEMISRGLPPRLPHKRPFGDYIAWLQNQDEDAAETYWRKLLSGFEAPTPLIMDRLARGQTDARHYAMLEESLSVDTTEMLREIVRGHHLTLNTLIQGVWALLLSRYCGDDDVVFGATVSGRPPDLSGSESMVGLFINTLPVRVQVDFEAEVIPWLQRLQVQQANTRQFEYSSLIEIQGWSDVPRTLPLFESILVFENYPASEALGDQRAAIHIENVQTVEQTNYPLTLVGAPGQTLGLRLAYDTLRFDAGSITRMLGHLRILLEGIAANPVRRLAELPMLTDSEMHRVFSDWQRIDSTLTTGTSIPKLFEAQVERTPSAIAVCFENKKLSYEALNRQANQLAHHLRNRGVGVGDFVGIYVEKSIEMMVALLGVLKSGAAYVPLDPAYPEDRIRFMLEDAGIKLVLSQARLCEHLPAKGVDIISLDGEWQFISQAPTENPDLLAMPQDAAYVIYTSGSTGVPKGVVIPHLALANHALAMAEATELMPTDRMLQFISLSFDAAGEEIYPTLLSGATVVVPKSTLDVLGGDLARFLAEQEITILHMPASVWHVMVDDLQTEGVCIEAPLRLLMLGGDKPSIGKLNLFSKLLGHPISFINMYGPTEATITSTFYETTTAHEQSHGMPIGKPIPNVFVLILDPAGQPVPLGVPGELLIGGSGLALGYLHQPDITESSFITWSMDDLPMQRLYRTGDMARYLPDGNIEFVGRRDEQAKIRGYRVEPGEIETLLSVHPTVLDAAVIVRQDHARQNYLAAYLVTSNGEALKTGLLRSYLLEQLPPYMVPGIFVVLDQLPRTPSGKLDRRTLIDMEGEHTRLSSTYEAPRGPEEEILVGIWSQVLGVDKVGIHDNFFELGGHSLLATQMVSRMREAFQIEAPLSTLFDEPTISGLAQNIKIIQDEELGLQAPPIIPLPRDGDLVLAFAQQRLWFLDQLEPGNLFYNMPMAVRIEGSFDIAALQYSLNEIIRRHEVLRTTFVAVDGDPRQVITSELLIDMPLIDLSDMPTADAETKAQALASAETRKPFDLSTGPMLRGLLVRFSQQDHLVVLVLHHIVADAWSVGVFMSELAILYDAFVRDEPSPLPDLPIQYADYAHWQRNWLQGEVLDAQLDYWKHQLGGAPALLDLPTDRPRPAVQTSNGATHTFQASGELALLLNELSQEEGVTLYMTLLAGFQLLLSRYSGQDDVSVGSAIANRTRGETEHLIGFFINTLVLRTDLSDDPTFRELLERVRTTALGAYAHQDVPFEMLVDVIQPERSLSYSPLFQVGFALQNTPVGVQEMPELIFRPLQLDSGSAKYDITLTMSEGKDGLTGDVEYNTDLFNATTIVQMMAHYTGLLAAAVATPDRPLSGISMLTPVEHQRMLVDWNDTAVAYPDHHTIHQLFEEQVTLRPDAVAATFAGKKLSYNELNRRANQIAHYLRSLGVGPETVVGISVERSLEMVAGILGILKAGGAYLPVDPTYPSERIIFMLEDSGAPVLITHDRVYAFLLESVALGTNRTVVRLDGESDTVGSFPEHNPAVAMSANNLAYVIYTSGSTGQPKGAMLSHRGLCNLADVQQRAFSIKEGKRVLQFSPFSFDASVWETVMALRNGATLVLASQEKLASGPELLRLMQEEGVTTVTLPPSLLGVLQPETLPQLETVIAAGEHCSDEIVERWSAGRRFFDAYGPTETTVCASMYLTDPGLSYPQGPPIGKPISNFQLYVVDPASLQPQPVGVPGELLVGGVGLARGYLQRPGLTAERFIPDHLSGLSGAHLYRTGDLVHYRPDGNIEFMGRIDHQVKVRGFRIELGEIESRLRHYSSLKESTVTVREDSPGDKRLVAYVVTKEDADLNVGDLKHFLRETLPEYMVPGTIVELEALPLTPANKIDRKALPAPDAARSTLDRAYVVPNTETERQLTEICAQLLHIDQVGIHDNFFELGGHSLLATQLISRMRDVFGLELPLRSLFEHPTVAELAIQVDITEARGPEKMAPTIKRIDRKNRRVKQSTLTTQRGNHGDMESSS